MATDSPTFMQNDSWFFIDHFSQFVPDHGQIPLINRFLDVKFFRSVLFSEFFSCFT